MKVNAEDRSANYIRMKMEPTNRRILLALQRDSRLAIAELAQAVNLSPSACHRRIKLMEEAGIIAGYAARLDRHALGLNMEFFVEVSLNSQSRQALMPLKRPWQRATKSSNAIITSETGTPISRCKTANGECAAM
jgi:DNA-binding Lrp family transcriptional regulator